MKKNSQQKLADEAYTLWRGYCIYSCLNVIQEFHKARKWRKAVLEKKKYFVSSYCQDGQWYATFKRSDPKTGEEKEWTEAVENDELYLLNQ